MNRGIRRRKRILALDPGPKGFGFVVLEASDRLLDWGVRATKDRNVAAALRRILRLVEEYDPDALVIEEIAANSRRHEGRPLRLLRRMAEVQEWRNVKIRTVALGSVRQTFPGCRNKHQLAVEIAAHFPELASRIFPYRKPWMTEDHRTGIFDAAALALTYTTRNRKAAVQSDEQPLAA